MFDVTNLITIIGIAQALFLMALVITRFKKGTPSHYALLLLFVFLLDLSMYLMLNLQLFDTLWMFIGVGEITLFLYGPVLYLYTRSVLGVAHNNGQHSKSYLHFVPAALVFILISPIFFGDFTFSFLNDLRGSLPDYFSIYNIEEVIFDFLVWYIHALGYFYITLRLIMRVRSRNNSSLKGEETLSHIKWVQVLLGGYFLFAVVSIVGFVLDPVLNLRITAYQVLNGFLVFHIFVISFIGFTNQQVLLTPLNRLKYSNSTLSDTDKKKYQNKILHYFEKEQPYLDQSLTLKKVSSQLDILQNHVSQVINEQMGFGFNEFVNRYRIELAKKQLIDPTKSMLTIEGIANEVGFRSKSSFNNAFKKECGLTPSAYKQKMLSK